MCVCDMFIDVGNVMALLLYTITSEDKWHMSMKRKDTTLDICRISTFSLVDAEYTTSQMKPFP